MDILRIVLAILLPPVAVFLTVGLGMHFWINILLTILGFIPGMIHALWVILKRRRSSWKGTKAFTVCGMRYAVRGTEGKTGFKEPRGQGFKGRGPRQTQSSVFSTQS
jgi:uncharacterized membrane protein YqaE (UPF0057 family)